MSADVPRRLPPTQGERVRNIDRSHASLSARGRTASARPVPQARVAAQTYTPSTANRVITGPGDTASVSISTTTDGGGASSAAGFNAVAVGRRARVSATQGVGIGDLATVDGTGGVAVGTAASAAGEAGVAVGPATEASANGSAAFGTNAKAHHAYSVAIGTDPGSGYVQTSEANEIVLGTVHTVKVPGGLILTDSSGGLHRLVVGTDGALSTVAYP